MMLLVGLLTVSACDVNLSELCEAFDPLTPKWHCNCYTFHGNRCTIFELLRAILIYTIRADRRSAMRNEAGYAKGRITVNVG